MFDIMGLIRELSGPCECGTCHETNIKDIRIGSGLTAEVGAILSENGFPKRLLLVADEDTLDAADGILDSLHGFDVETQVYGTLRVATMKLVKELEVLLSDGDMGVLAVGTGSVHDICRLAAARAGKMLCLFATAPSMDGFASYSSPIVDGNFKMSFPAKSPEVIIGDTKVLVAAPVRLKSAGFGDMAAKYTALIDWQISHLLTGEPYCEKVAKLTRDAVDDLFALADRVTADDEYTAGLIFAALLKTGIGMSFTQNSRPASGAEHVVAHLIECLELLDGITPNFHGDDVGVCTLELLKCYNRLAQYSSITTACEQTNWDDVFGVYGPMAEDVRKMNFPDNVVDGVAPEKLRECWSQICNIIGTVPDYEQCRDAMKRAGCCLTVEDIGKEPCLFGKAMLYSPYMRRRMTLLRLYPMIGEFEKLLREEYQV